MWVYGGPLDRPKYQTPTTAQRIESDTCLAELLNFPVGGFRMSHMVTHYSTIPHMILWWSPSVDQIWIANFRQQNWPWYLPVKNILNFPVGRLRKTHMAAHNMTMPHVLVRKSVLVHQAPSAKFRLENWQRYRPWRNSQLSGCRIQTVSHGRPYLDYATRAFIAVCLGRPGIKCEPLAGRESSGQEKLSTVCLENCVEDG
jgi:hypothetical protein